MSRLKARAELQRKKFADQERQAGFWPGLSRQIEIGQVIPIISNAVYIDRIFDIDEDQIIGISPNLDNPRGWSVEEQITDAWAQEIAYPLPETHKLPKVALYDRLVNSVDDFSAKRRYLNWLKDTLLFLAEDDVDVDAETIKALRDDLERMSFADIVVELDYPKLVEGKEDPLQILARLPMPIYITTSYYDFVERALVAAGKRPRIQICYWTGEPVNINFEHRLDHDFQPSVEEPLVFHLYGFEEYLETLVLSENDYLGFLRSISRDSRDQSEPIIPFYLRKALMQSTLLLLGYQMKSWEFKALFRGVLKSTSSVRMFRIAVQPDKFVEDQRDEKVIRYVEEYFGESDITVEWDMPDNFLQTLWQEWVQWSR